MRNKASQVLDGRNNASGIASRIVTGVLGGLVILGVGGAGLTAMINHGYDQGLEVGKSEGKASARAKYISGVDRDGDGTNEFKVVTNGGATNYFVSNPVPAVYDINGRRLRGLEGDFVLALSAAEAELARLNRRSVKEQENLQASTAAKLRYLTSELNLDQREVKEKYGLIITGGQK